MNNANFSETNENFFRSSYARSSNFGEEIVSAKNLIETCKQQGINLTQLPDRRLESGLSMLSFWGGKLSDSQQSIVVFVTRYNMDSLNVAVYQGGKPIDKKTVKNENQAVSVIKAALSRSNGSNSKQSLQNIQAGGKLIEKLNAKCAQLCKQQKTEMMAMQKLKTTEEYRNLLEHQLQLNMQIESYTDSLQKMHSHTVTSSESLVPTIIAVEELKEQIDELQYEYDSILCEVRNVREILNKHLENSRKKVESMSVSNEEDLNAFLTEAKKFKKLEYQKKFLL